jgi:hypothetical protein
MDRTEHHYQNIKITDGKVLLGDTYNTYNANGPEILDSGQLAKVLRARKQRVWPVDRIEDGFPSLKIPKFHLKHTKPESGSIMRLTRSALHKILADDHTLFLEYCETGQISRVRRLLQHGFNPNQTGGTCGNALQTAIVTNDEDLFDLLIRYGADTDERTGEPAH